ncbi:MAG: hypothetical protein BGP06_10260 [Rhizobiales bacterium 65-9]|nr:hypothetical protein [Hyphomicrobiales bacterium]OJY32168.1 MAG: hypothetical protein BGP06_10260 [Rhizobiales bacterium 65-9]
MRSLLGLIVGVVIGVGAFWVYMTYTIASPDDPGWVAINSRLPGAAREWSCKLVKNRLKPLGPAPIGCEEHWG